MSINQSNALHGGVALLFQLAVLLATGNAWAGGLAAVMFFLGREHMDRQRQIAKQRGMLVVALKPWEGFDILRWSEDSQWDLYTPAICAVIGYFGLPHVVALFTG